MDNPFKDKDIDALQTLVNLSVNSNATLHTILDLLVDIKAKLDDKPKEEINSLVEQLLKDRHDLSFDLVKVIDKS